MFGHNPIMSKTGICPLKWAESLPWKNTRITGAGYRAAEYNFLCGP